MQMPKMWSHWLAVLAIDERELCAKNVQMLVLLHIVIWVFQKSLSCTFVSRAQFDTVAFALFSASARWRKLGGILVYRKRCGSRRRTVGDMDGAMMAQGWHMETVQGGTSGRRPKKSTCGGE